MAPELVLEETPHGCQVHYQGRALYGPRPVPDADRRVTARNVDPGTLIVWSSPVLWHGWRELSERLGTDTSVVAIEADPVLHELARRHLPPDTRITLVPATLSAAIDALRRAGEHRYRRVLEISTTASALTHRSHYRDLIAALEREVRVFWQNRITLAAMGRLWLSNAIANIPQLCHARTAAPRAGPAVVCGAGPSLESAIPLIRDKRSRMTLIAVDTALPVLDSHGLTPDLAVALEGQIANAYDFLPVATRDYQLVTDLSACPAVARLHPRTTWTVAEFAPFSLVKRLSNLPGVQWALPPLGSVGVAAVRVALDLGCSPVVCAGLDFAVLPGMTHARGAPAYLNELSRANRLHRVRDPAVGARLIDLPGCEGRVQSTLILQGYAGELARIVGERRDVYAAAPSGLFFGAKPVSVRDARVILDRAPPALARGAPFDTAVADGTLIRPTLVEFVRLELSRLTRFSRTLSGHGQNEPTEIPAALDYLACEAPDQILSFASQVSLRRPDVATWRRLRVAADYYTHRWRTTLDLLETTS